MDELPGKPIKQRQTTMKFFLALLGLALCGCTTITPAEYADYEERQRYVPEAAPPTPVIIVQKTF